MEFSEMVLALLVDHPLVDHWEQERLMMENGCLQCIPDTTIVATFLVFLERTNLDTQMRFLLGILVLGDQSMIVVFAVVEDSAK